MQSVRMHNPAGNLQRCSPCDWREKCPLSLLNRNRATGQLHHHASTSTVTRYVCLYSFQRLVMF